MFVAQVTHATLSCHQTGLSCVGFTQHGPLHQQVSEK